MNVGHFKGYELPLEFFMNMAWDPTGGATTNFDEFTRLWAEREFGPEHATDIADLVAKYTKYNGRRKPELLAPDTYSLVNYQEAETVVSQISSPSPPGGSLFIASCRKPTGRVLRTGRVSQRWPANW